MLQRIRQAIEAGRTAVLQADAERVDTSGYPQEMTNKSEFSPPATPKEVDPVLALLALDELGSAAPELTRKHLAAAKAAGTRALFITGSASELDFFPDRSLLCEYLPSHQEIFGATEERSDVITLYRQHRLQLILDKWRVQDCNWIGDSAAELIPTKMSEATRPVRFHKIQ